MMKRCLPVLIVIAMAFQISPLKSQDNQPELIIGGQTQESPVRPGAIASDRTGNIYVYSQGTNEILSFTRDFKFRFRFGGFGTEQEAFIEPFDILVNKDSIIVTDVGSIKIFDLSGKFQKNITKLKGFDLKRPAGLSIDTRDKIYVCDIDIGKIFMLDSTFEPIRIIEGFKSPMSLISHNDGYYLLEEESKSFMVLSGSMAKIKTVGPFKNPMCLVTDYSQKLYVLDGNEVRTFTLGGIASKTVSFAPRAASGRFCPIALDNGKMIVSSTLTNEVLQLEENGKVTPRLQGDSSRLCLPSGFAIDENGKIYISDTGNKSVRVLDQKGNQLYKLDKNPTGRISISKDLVSMVNDSQIQVCDRAGNDVFTIPEQSALDSDFEPSGNILVLKKDSVIKYNGSTKIETVIDKQQWGQPTSISSIGTHFAITDFENSKIMVFDSDGKPTNSMTLNDSPYDCIMLSEQRIMVCCESSLLLLDHSGKVLRSFGKNGGPFWMHGPIDEKISYESNLDQFTQPLALARFGQWIYVLDRLGMRLVRYPKEVLLESPRIKISPEIVDFKYVQKDSEENQEIVIQNTGGDSLEGYFSSIPKWVTLSTRTIKGDEVIVKVKANTLHFIPNRTYRENIVLESNAGKFVIPCMLKIPETMPDQIDVEFQIGVKSITVNGKKIELPVAPYIKNGSTMIPLQFITSSFGGATEFDSGYISINFPRKNVWVVCEIGSESSTIQRDDQTSTLPMKPSPELKSGKPCLSLSFFTDLLDCEVYWDKATKKIRIVYLP